MPETDDVLTCDLCGGALDAEDWAATELRVEVSREEDGELRYWVADFCTQEHAAEWFRRPLPSPQPPAPIEQSPWRDRAEAAGCFGALTAVLLLVVVGAWNVVEWALDLL
ncbi:hypothetical protein JKP75_06865 [Blastococcus sp. TML/M2B]|uniref:hypothetical protein n=1 Tax=unclassified Blastococcus TaxID=2619396 RepID=UPI00190C63BD|nr:MULTISPECIES: hypothetical protein [unclassified Blastococcus]MBN1092311.1 hypothetical protein [Blastococcus sp. TML/M2B]MBN1097597.1 hypothetical protein [Blastococcus sp. TML/C7B]